MDPSFVLSLVLGAASVGGGVFAWTSKRLYHFDTRLDQVEMTMHKEFVRKDELLPMMDRLDQRIQRIDEKLDRILINGRNPSAWRSDVLQQSGASELCSWFLAGSHPWRNTGEICRLLEEWSKKRRT